jgi:hypothetical protein
MRIIGNFALCVNGKGPHDLGWSSLLLVEKAYILPLNFPYAWILINRFFLTLKIFSIYDFARI